MLAREDEQTKFMIERSAPIAIDSGELWWKKTHESGGYALIHSCGFLKDQHLKNEETAFIAKINDRKQMASGIVGIVSLRDVDMHAKLNGLPNIVRTLAIGCEPPAFKNWRAASNAFLESYFEKTKNTITYSYYNDDGSEEIIDDKLPEDDSVVIVMSEAMMDGYYFAHKCDFLVQATHKAVVSAKDHRRTKTEKEKIAKETRELWANIARAAFCRDAMRGLSVMHSCGVMHGDVKLNNVLISNWDSCGVQAVLCDFGLSETLVGKAGSTVGRESWIICPYSRAPEVWTRDSDFGLKSDIWAMASVVFYVFTQEYLIDFDPKTDVGISIAARCFALYRGTFQKPSAPQFHPKNKREVAQQKHNQIDPQGRWTVEEICWHPDFNKAPTLIDRMKLIWNRHGADQLGSLLATFLCGALEMMPEKRWTAEQCLDCEFMQKYTVFCNSKDFAATWRIPGWASLPLVTALKQDNEEQEFTRAVATKECLRALKRNPKWARVMFQAMSLWDRYAAARSEAESENISVVSSSPFKSPKSQLDLLSPSSVVSSSTSATSTTTTTITNTTTTTDSSSSNSSCCSSCCSFNYSSLSGSSENSSHLSECCPHEKYLLYSQKTPVSSLSNQSLPYLDARGNQRVEELSKDLNIGDNTGNNQRNLTADECRGALHMLAYVAWKYFDSPFQFEAKDASLISFNILAFGRDYNMSDEDTTILNEYFCDFECFILKEVCQGFEIYQHTLLEAFELFGLTNVDEMHEEVVEAALCWTPRVSKSAPHNEQESDKQSTSTHSLITLREVFDDFVQSEAFAKAMSLVASKSITPRKTPRNKSKKN